MRHLFCWSALLLLPGTVVAQDCHLSLRGHVYEAGINTPLAYATISIKGIGKGAIADENGYFAITDLCENTLYTVEVSHVECAHYTRELKLTENTQIDFLLEHDKVLNEVLIRERAIAPPPTQAAVTVDKNDLENGRGLNLGETLKKLPGVSLLQTGATIAKPVIQGLHSNRIAIVNNNVVLEGQQWGSEHAPEVDPFTADRIQVIKGAAGIRYGVGAMGGAVVMTPAPLRKTAGANGWLSLGGFSNGLGGVAAGSADWRPRATKGPAFRLQGTLKRSGSLRAPNYWLGNTGAAEGNLFAMSTWARARQHHELSASYFNLKLGVMRAAHVGSLEQLTAAINAAVPANNDSVFRWTIQRPYQQVQHSTLKYNGIFHWNEKWKLNTQYSLQYNHRLEYDVVRKTGAAATRPQVSFDLWTNTLDAAIEHEPIRHWQGSAGVQGVYQYNTVGRGGFIPDYTGLSGALWWSERWRRYPNPWEVEFGARYDYRWNHATTDGSLRNLDTVVYFGGLSATLGLIYHLSEQFSLTAHSSTAFRPPHVNELFARGVHFAAGTYEEGFSGLQPERGWNNNLNLLYQHGQTYAALTLYYNRIQDYIYLNPGKEQVLTIRGPFPAYYYRQADATLRGVDASLNLPLHKNWILETRASILRAGRRAKDETGNAYEDWLPLISPDRFQYGLRYLLPKNNGQESKGYINVYASTVARQIRIPAEGLLKAAPAAFTLFNLDAGYKVQIGKFPLEIGINLQNLGNTAYRNYLNFFRLFADEPGFNAGLRMKLLLGKTGNN